MDMAGKFSTEGMSSQAQKLWGMLDDMAQNDPAAYRKFIQKQLEEGKEQLAPPDPHMCVQVKLVSPKPGLLYVNFLAWKRVPAPKTPDDAVPVTGTELSREKDEKGVFSLISVAFNPKILEEYGRESKNPTDADTLVQLAFDYIENECKVKVSRTYTILPVETLVKGELELVQMSLSKRLRKSDEIQKDLDHLEKAFGPKGENGIRTGLMDRLAKLSTMDDGEISEAASSKGGGEPQSYNLRMPGAKAPAKKGLIQELGGSSSGGGGDGGGSSVAGLPIPSHSLQNTLNDGCRCLELRVELPGVGSVGQCELDISEDDVVLTVSGRFGLRLPLPSRVDPDRARARMRKRAGVLTLTMPTA